MNQDIKIAVIVVTYNRSKLIAECLRGILDQTRPVDQIFLIDNNSTDNTSELFNNEFSNYKNISYTKLKQNTGSAGGFNFGVDLAYKAGYDWMWFLDDDITPENNCLSKMLEYQNISGCIHPSKYDINKKEFLWEPIFDPAIGRASFLNNISFKNGKDFTFVNIGCFEGMLIKRDVIKKIGLPDPRFFIAGDDTLYGFVASLFTNVIFVKEAKIRKLLPFNYGTSAIFLYYSTRNIFLIKEYLKKYELYKAVLFNWYFILYIISISTKQAIRSGTPIKSIFYIVRAVIDGIKGKYYKFK